MWLHAQPGHDDDRRVRSVPGPAAASQRHLRLDGAYRAGRKRGRERGPRRRADHRAAEDKRVVGVGVTGEIEVALTEEFETTVAEQAEDLAVGETAGDSAVIDFQEAGQVEAVDIDALLEGGGEADATLGTTKIQHAARERGRARELFEKLATLPAGDPGRGG